MLTVGENTRLYKGIRYITPAVNHTAYWVWKNGVIPDGPGAYAVNAPPPPIENVINGGIFCAGVPNLLLRAAGKRIPFRLNAAFDRSIDGGIAAYFDGAFGPGYFHNFEKPLNIREAKRVAENTRSGVLIGWPYRGNWPLSMQGHVGVLLPSGYVLQSFIDPWGPDLNWSYTIEAFSAGINNAVMVMPWDWIEYKGDEF